MVRHSAARAGHGLRSDHAIGLDLEHVDGAVDRETQRAFMNTTDDQVVGGAEGPLRQTQLRAKVDELIYNEKQNEVVFVKYLD